MTMTCREWTSLLLKESDSDSLSWPISDDSDSIHDSLCDRNLTPYNRGGFADIFKSFMLFLHNFNLSAVLTPIFSKFITFSGSYLLHQQGKKLNFPEFLKDSSNDS